MDRYERKVLMSDVDSKAVSLLRGLDELVRKDPETRMLWEQAQELAGRARSALVVEIVKDKR